jgi:hypothetical protein
MRWRWKMKRSRLAVGEGSGPFHQTILQTGEPVMGCVFRQENKFAMRDAPVVETLNAVVAEHARRGFWKFDDAVAPGGLCMKSQAGGRVYCQLNSLELTSL